MRGLVSHRTAMSVRSIRGCSNVFAVCASNRQLMTGCYQRRRTGAVRSVRYIWPACGARRFDICRLAMSNLERYFAFAQASGCDFALSPPALTAVTT